MTNMKFGYVEICVKMMTKTYEIMNSNLMTEDLTNMMNLRSKECWCNPAYLIN